MFFFVFFIACRHVYFVCRVAQACILCTEHITLRLYLSATLLIGAIFADAMGYNFLANLPGPRAMRIRFDFVICFRERRLRRVYVLKRENQTRRTKRHDHSHHII